MIIIMFFVKIPNELSFMTMIVLLTSHGGGWKLNYINSDLIRQLPDDCSMICECSHTSIISKIVTVGNLKSWLLKNNLITTKLLKS